MSGRPAAGRAPDGSPHRPRRRIAGLQTSTALLRGLIENVNGQFKGICDCHGAVPTRDRLATKRFALGAGFVYLLGLRHRFTTGDDLRVGLKAFLCTA